MVLRHNPQFKRFSPFTHNSDGSQLELAVPLALSHAITHNSDGSKPLSTVQMARELYSCECVLVFTVKDPPNTLTI